MEVTQKYELRVSFNMANLLEINYFLLQSRRDHSIRTFAKFSEKLTFFTPWYAKLICEKKDMRKKNLQELKVNIKWYMYDIFTNAWNLATLRSQKLPKNATSGTYLFEANNGNIRSIREIYSELTIKTLEKR